MVEHIFKPQEHSPEKKVLRVLPANALEFDSTL